MPGSTRRTEQDPRSKVQDARQLGRALRPELFPRPINVSWAGITDADLMPGELVWNQADYSLVYRAGDALIVRYDYVTSRAI